MKPLAIALLLAAATAAAVAQTQPATGPATNPANLAAVKFEAEWRQQFDDYAERFPRQPARPIEKILTLAVKDGQLEVKVAQDLPADASVVLADSRTAIAVQKHAGARGSFPEVNLLRLEGFGTPAPSIRLMRVADSSMAVFADVTDASPTTEIGAQLVDTYADNSPAGGDPATTTLYLRRAVNLNPGGEAKDDADNTVERNVKAKAASFAALIEAHHDDVHAMMFGLFADLHAVHVMAGLSEAEARQLVLKPADDAAALGELIALIDRGDDASTADARKRLAGPNGRALAGALSAADRRGWPLDRSMRVDALLADVTPLAQKDARRLLDSTGRLIDLLYWPDVEIRRGAKLLVERKLGKPIDVDPAADPYANLAAIEALRAPLK